MPIWLALLGLVVLASVGLWTIRHPNGGYRAVGGVGSGLSPSTRRVAGYVLVALSLAVFVMIMFDAT